MPPSLGIVSAISARAFAAVAEAVTTAGSIPATLSEYFFKETPKVTNSSPKLAMLFSPVNQATMPPSLGTTLAISARALAAVAEAVTAEESIPTMLSAYALKYGPNSESCLPKETIEEPPVIQLAILENISTSDITKAAFARFAMPETTDESIDFAPSTKPFIFIMKSDRFWPICGSPLVTPAEKLPTRFPINVPIALPSIPRTLTPSPSSQSNPGI